MYFVAATNSPQLSIRYSPIKTFNAFRSRPKHPRLI